MEECKTKKMKEGCENGATRAHLWSDLHTCLLELILRHIPLEDRISFRWVCRSWHEIEKQTPPLPQLPWLMLKPDYRLKVEEFFSLTDGQVHPIKLPGLSLLDCMASCSGWLLMGDDLSGIWFLLNPVSRKRIPVPMFKSSAGPLSYKFLVSDPTSPNDVIVVLSWRTSIWIFQPNLDMQEWEEKRLPALWFRGCSNIIGCNGMLYLLDFKLNLAVVDPRGGEPALLELDGSPLASQVFLVESLGEILLVSAQTGHRVNLIYRYFYDEDDRLLYRFEVFKADLDAMAWVKVERLYNRMLFLSERSCFSISAEDGVKGNRIYFLPPYPEEFNHWIEFDLDDGIPIARLLPDHQRGCLDTWKWLMPSLR